MTLVPNSKCIEAAGKASEQILYVSRRSVDTACHELAAVLAEAQAVGRIAAVVREISDAAIWAAIEVGVRDAISPR